MQEGPCVPGTMLHLYSRCEAQGAMGSVGIVDQLFAWYTFMGKMAQLR